MLHRCRDIFCWQICRIQHWHPSCTNNFGNDSADPQWNDLEIRNSVVVYLNIICVEVWKFTVAIICIVDKINIKFSLEIICIIHSEVPFLIHRKLIGLEFILSGEPYLAQDLVESIVQNGRSCGRRNDRLIFLVRSWQKAPSSPIRRSFVPTLRFNSDRPF